MSASVTVPIAPDTGIPRWKRHLLIPALAAGVLFLGLCWARLYVAAAVSAALLGVLTYLLLRRFDGSRRVTFTVGDGKLTVSGDFFADSFFLSELDLEKAEAVDLGRDKARALKWKTMGTGMPGYYSGEYTLADGRNAVVFVADKSRVLYLPRRSQLPLLISVADPAAFLQALREAAGRRID